MAEEKNKTIKSALNEMEYLTGDEEVRRMAELQEKWERDRISEISYAKKEGIKEGIEKGEKHAKLETAKKMLKMKLPIEKIIEATGLTKEEIMENTN